MSALPHIAKIHEHIADHQELELGDGCLGYLDFDMMTEDGAVPFIYTWFPGDEAPPALWLPLVGVRLFEETATERATT